MPLTLEEYVQRFCLQNDGITALAMSLDPVKCYLCAACQKIEIQLWEIFDMNSTETEAV